MRQIISLNGIWKFCVDMGVCGGNYIEPDYPRDGWLSVEVPGCWNCYGEKYKIYEGVSWYAKELHLPEVNPDTIGTLYFEGVNYLCEIWLNGEKIGSHEGGYTPFNFDVSEKLRKGRNVLVLKVDNRWHLLRMPFVVGWFNYGGIHRPVFLHLSETLQIKKFILKTEAEEKRLIIDYKLETKKPFKEFHFLFSIYDGEKNIFQIKDELSLAGALSIPVPFLQNWSPEKPFLYKAVLEVCNSDGKVLDSVEKNFGIRSLELKEGKILLNGKTLKLKGINYLPINPISGLTYSREMVDKDLHILKELGVNAIRIHFPLSEDFFSECDKTGLLVWCDIPVYCLETYAGIPEDFFQREENYNLAQQYFRESYLAYHHHPAIITWSLGNECSTWLSGAKKFFERLIEVARDLEKNRFLSYASLSLMRKEEEGFFNQLDIIGLNEYFGWYDKLGKNYENWKGEKPDLTILRERLSEFFKRYKKPVVLTEFGADSLPNYRSSDLVLGSEDYQATFLEETFKVLKEFPQIIGYFPFSFNDYPDPSKSLVRFWSEEINHKGVVSFNRDKKYSFEVLRKIYQKL